jgi:YD repeat-containing protein
LGVLRSTFVRYGLRASFVVLACCLSHAQTPSITSISPNPVGIGQSVTISGTNLGTSGSVTFSGVAASTISWASTAIIATVPVGTTTGNIVVTAGGHSSSPYQFTLNNGPVSYVYDDLGRLIAVIDVNGNAAEYSYDIVGNIQSISRLTSAQVSIIDFSPESGPTGALVTINGTGFSTTPSQDTVKFNSVTATVSSATNTQLQVAVPATAATGPISATSPNGTATSSASFTVTSSDGVPTITSFGPTSGVSGTTIGLVGTNFDPTLANDELRLNASPAVVTVVSPTTMTTTVPAVTSSGRFTLIAPAGTAVSSGDFYVPFLGYAPSAIGYTARITPGGSQTVTLGTNQIGLVLFDGTFGQHAAPTITGSTFSSCSLYLINPIPTSVNNDLGACSANGGFGPVVLTQNGTYTFGIVGGASGGRLTLSLSVDFVGTIAINGPPVTASTPEPGQDAHLNFEATGQRVVVYATNVTNPNALVNLVTPSGTTLSSMGINNGQPGQTFFMDTQALGVGMYQLWIQHNASVGGSETLQIVSVPPDFSGTLSVPAAGTTGTATRVPASGNLAVGQNANLTFSGTAGQKLSFNVVSSTIGANTAACSLTVYDPNQNPIPSGYCGTGASYVDTMTLALTGTYTVNLNPIGTATGSVSISINNDQDVTTPAIAIGGSAVTPITTAAGQDIRLSFTASANQLILVTATNVTYPFPPYENLNLLTPSGSTLASTTIGSSSGGSTSLIDTQTLPAAGTYQLWVQHNGPTTGGVTLQIISVPAAFTGTLAVAAAGATGTATRVPTSGNLAVGQNANLTFSGTAGQKLSFNLVSSTIGANAAACALTVYDPNQNALSTGYCGTGASYVDTITLALTGTYTVNLNPTGTATGSVSISINNDQDVTTPAISIGEGVITFKTTVVGQDIRLSFTPTASQPRIAVLATSVTNPYALLNLVTPSGSVQAQTPIDNNPSGQTFFIDTQTVTASEQYQLWVQHSGTNFGNVVLQIKNVPANVSHTVTVNGAAYSFSTAIGQNANIGFSISASEPVTVHWTSSSKYPSCNMTVTGPSPSTSVVGTGYCNATTGSISLGTLSSGAYNILIDPQAQSTGGLSLTVTSP